MGDSSSSTASGAVPAGVICAARYLALLDELTRRAALLDPPPDSVVGIARSGLFPSVLLSHRLELPWFAARELSGYPAPRLQWPLIVDSVAWSGTTLRRCQRRLCQRGVPPAQARALVLFARAEPLPQVPQLEWLELCRGIPRFWYMLPLAQAPPDSSAAASPAPAAQPPEPESAGPAPPEPEPGAVLTGGGEPYS